MITPPAARHDAEEPEAWSRCEQNRRRDPWRWHDLQLWTSPAAGNKQTNKQRERKKNKQSYKQPKLIIFMKQVLHQVSNTITTIKHKKTMIKFCVQKKHSNNLSTPRLYTATKNRPTTSTGSSRSSAPSSATASPQMNMYRRWDCFGCLHRCLLPQFDTN